MIARPGDLCLIVRAGPGNEHYLGSPLRVTHAYCLPIRGGTWCWHYEGEPCFFSWDGTALHINDDCLHPIRPPGEQKSTDVPRELEAA